MDALYRVVSTELALGLRLLFPALIGDAAHIWTMNVLTFAV